MEKRIEQKDRQPRVDSKTNKERNIEAKMTIVLSIEKMVKARK